MKQFERKRLGNQQGFTLIEIIAVLVILGILAAVAVPRFINLTADAQDKALEGALAAGFSNVTLSYSRFLLQNNGVIPDTITGNAWTVSSATVTDSPIATDLGDYSASYGVDASVSPPQVTVVITPDAGVGGSGTQGTFDLP